MYQAMEQEEETKSFVVTKELSWGWSGYKDSLPDSRGLLLRGPGLGLGTAWGRASGRNWSV